MKLSEQLSKIRKQKFVETVLGLDYFKDLKLDLDEEQKYIFCSLILKDNPLPNGLFLQRLEEVDNAFKHLESKIDDIYFAAKNPAFI